MNGSNILKTQNEPIEYENVLESPACPPDILGLTGSLVLVGAVFALAQSSKTKTNPTDLNVPVDQTAVPRDGLPRGSFAPIVDKVAPAVVKIEITATRRNAAMEGMPDSLRQFFGNQFGGMLPPQSMRPRVEHGVGSGVVITKDGYILTNNHVVDGAKEVKVTLTDGREFTAKVIGRDPKTDIAVVKIDADNLPVVPLADSSKVKVGDVVLAVGNPFGVGQTVTEGIVSAKNRGNVGIEDYEDFIQTDAAINPGNSGGALVDIDGRLIGINTAILSDSGGSQGVGFAVPSDLARTVMESLVKDGHVTRGYIGVMIQNVTPALAQEFNLKESTGALIGDVVANGPADQAGFKEGDVVTVFNGQKITDSRQLQLTRGRDQSRFKSDGRRSCATATARPSKSPSNNCPAPARWPTPARKTGTTLARSTASAWAISIRRPARSSTFRTPSTAPW